MILSSILHISHIVISGLRPLPSSIENVHWQREGSEIPLLWNVSHLKGDVSDILKILHSRLLEEASIFFELRPEFGKFLKPHWLIAGSCYGGSDLFQFTLARAGLF